MLALVGQHIKTMGYKVLEASDGEQAWALAQEHLPDLVILDVMMPGMSGWEVCRKIREDIALAHTAIIMLTGIGENLNELTSPLYGADSYIDKPFAFPELDEKVRGALTKRRGSRPGLARTEPDDGQEKTNGNGNHERSLLSPPESTESDAPEEGEVDDAWTQEQSGHTNGTDESIMLVPTGETQSSPPMRRRRSARPNARKSTRAKAEAAKPIAKAQPVQNAKPAPKAKAIEKAKASGKPKRVAKARPKTAAKPKAKPAVRAKPKAVAKAKPKAVAKAKPKVAKAKPKVAAKAKSQPRAAKAKAKAPSARSKPVSKKSTAKSKKIKRR
jgi:CheY-like chemotaxis protein